MAQTIRVRPGPGVSMIGAIAGVAFVLLGVFVVVPIFGAFGLFWTALALIICVAHFYNAFSKRGIATDVIEVSHSHDPEGDSSRESDVESRLRTLEELREKGLVSDDEYEERRRDILRRL